MIKQNSLMVFENAEFGRVRTVTINGEPWFVGKDVAVALGYSNASKALTDHVDDEDKLNNESLSSLGQRGGWLINESGLYSLIMSNKLPSAKRFKHWVTSEVLPSTHNVEKVEKALVLHTDHYAAAEGNRPTASLDIMNISGVECYEKDGTAYLRLETVARGLGFTEIAASGNECIRWRTVRKYLLELGIATSCDGGNLPDFIPENIFYRLAMKAKNAVAEAFQAKIADEVIPSIRKHGAYMTPETLEAAVLNPDTLLKIALALKEERDKRIALEVKNESLVAANEIMTPKADYYDALVERNVLTSFRETAKEFQVSEKALIAWLLDNKYIYRSKSGKLMPYVKKQEQGLFETKEYCGEAWAGTQTMITPKGRKILLPLVKGLRKQKVENDDPNQIRFHI